jgi:hypothetical protein
MPLGKKVFGFGLFDNQSVPIGVRTAQWDHLIRTICNYCILMYIFLFVLTQGQKSKKATENWAKRQTAKIHTSTMVERHRKRKANVLG